MFGTKSAVNEARRLKIEVQLLRAAIFRASPEIANAYRAVITDIINSPADLDREVIEVLGELAAEANEAVGVPTFQ